MGNKRRSISKRFGDSAEKSNSSTSGFIEPDGNVKELIEAILERVHGRNICIKSRG